MIVSAVLDSAGRRRSPATLPGFHAGRPPRNKGMRYPADPPTVEEIIAVMRHASDNRHGWRLRALIVVLWRGGLRIQEPLALAEPDLDPRCGSLLVRHGKGDRRREIGMGRLGMGTAAPLADLPSRSACRATVLRHRRSDPWTPMVECCRARRASSARQPGRGATPVRATPATSCPRPGARAGGRTAEHHPTPARPCQPGNDIDLPPRHRYRRDHRRRPHKTGTNDVRHRRPTPLRPRPPKGGSPRALPPEGRSLRRGEAYASASPCASEHLLAVGQRARRPP
jgi:hypothetical protein